MQKEWCQNSRQGALRSNRAPPVYCQSLDRGQNNYRRVSFPSFSNGKMPQPICVLITHGNIASQLLMMPGTGADVTVMGPQHPESPGFSCSSLQPPSLPTMTITANCSAMAPALGIFPVQELILRTSVCLIVCLQDFLWIDMIFIIPCSHTGEWTHPIWSKYCGSCCFTSPRPHTLAWWRHQCRYY